MTTKLTLYNGALEILGQRSLASEAENVEARRQLDRVWDRDAIKYCLEQGLWKFAIRTVEGTFSPSVTPPFGYTYAYNRPNNYVRLVQISADERFSEPLLDYRSEASYWFCDYDVIWLSYISDDTNGYGGDMSVWPDTFVRFVEAYLARMIRERVARGAVSYEKIERIYKDNLRDAKSKDAIEDPTKFTPVGQWRRARQGRRYRDSLWNRR